jgi:hypothetical protein
MLGNRANRGEGETDRQRIREGERQGQWREKMTWVGFDRWS